METEQKYDGDVEVIKRQMAELAFRFDGTERNGTERKRHRFYASYCTYRVIPTEKKFRREKLWYESFLGTKFPGLCQDLNEGSVIIVYSPVITENFGKTVRDLNLVV